MQGIPYLIVPDSSQAGDKEYERRGHEGWKGDHARFKDFPFQHYRTIFNPLDLSEEPTVGDVHDDFADIYGELWHGLKALNQGDGIYAIEHWRFSYFYHWGEHAAAALRAIDHYFRQTGFSETRAKFQDS